MRYVIGNSENLLMNNYHRLTLVLAIALALGLAPPAFGAAVKQKTFASAEEGVKALIEATKKNDRTPFRDPRSGGQVPHRIGRSSFASRASASSNLMRSKQAGEVGRHQGILEVEKTHGRFPYRWSKRMRAGASTPMKERKRSSIGVLAAMSWT
jgi:hypothetical protein